MIQKQCQSYPISIFIGGNAKNASLRARAYCDDVGLCVTVTETRYMYTGGMTFGVIVGLINYPRFPLIPEQLWAHAEALGERLCKGLQQESYTIQAPDRTVFFSHREEDLPTPVEPEEETRA